VEDARTCVELVRMKLRYGPDFGVDPNTVEHIFQAWGHLGRELFARVRPTSFQSTAFRSLISFVIRRSSFEFFSHR